MFRRLFARSSLALCCLALAAPLACKESPKKEEAKTEKTKDEDDGAGKAKKKAKGAEGDDADDEAKPKKKKAKGAEGSDADDEAKPTKKDALGYDAAMKAGREKVGKKDYAGAIEAFDDACVARDGDAQAFGERGYAKVLDKQYDAGIKDLDAALAKTDDAKLLGPIWYNLGLAREGKSDKKGAIDAYRKSNELRPTKAAQAKLDTLGDTTTAVVGCPAKADTRRVEAKRFAGWLALFQALAKKGGVDAPATPPTSDAAAKKLLCVDDCKGPGPWIVRFGAADNGGGSDVIGLAGMGKDGKLFAWDDVGGGWVARCTSSDIAQVMPSSIALVRVHVLSEPQELTYADDHGKSCNPGDTGCLSGCVSERWTETDQYYDVESLVRVASVAESGKQGSNGKHTRATKIDANAKGEIGITGGGCNQLLKTVQEGKLDANMCAPPADKDAFKCAEGKKCPPAWEGDAGNTCRRICSAKTDCKVKGAVCNNAFGGNHPLCDGG